MKVLTYKIKPQISRGLIESNNGENGNGKIEHFRSEKNIFLQVIKEIPTSVSKNEFIEIVQFSSWVVENVKISVELEPVMLVRRQVGHPSLVDVAVESFDVGRKVVDVGHRRDVAVVRPLIVAHLVEMPAMKTKV